jgi:hypothetical protein
MEAIVVKISRVGARCCRASIVCTSQGCARAREDVYRLEPERCIAPEWRFSTLIEQGTSDLCTRESKVDYV